MNSDAINVLEGWWRNSGNTLCLVNIVLEGLRVKFPLTHSPTH
jgi:hypothetical protein